MNWLPHMLISLFKHFRREKGSSPYIVPIGGSSYMGAFGYITAFQEMIEQVGKVT